MDKPINEKQLATLEQIVRQQIDAHERLLALVEEKLEALRDADRQRVTDCCKRENEQVQRIGELEKQRLTLVAELTLVLEPAAKEPMRMGDLAERLEEPARGRLLVLRQQLRERVETVRYRSSVAHRATESLVRHMHGILQTIGAAVSGVAVYNRTGARPRAVTTMSTFSATA